MGEISVRVQYLGILRNTLGCREERITVPEEASVEDVLQVLREKHGEQFTSIMFRRDGGLRPLVRILLDSQNIRDGAGVETRLGKLERRPPPGSPWEVQPREPEPDPSGWDRKIDEAWSRREGAVLSGTWAASEAAGVLGSSKLSDTHYKTLQGLLDASEYLRSKWSRDRNTITRGNHEIVLMFGTYPWSGG
ncbi:MAG: MoaD/ThiS family protein [Dehalococcoidia bacterium]